MLFQRLATYQPVMETYKIIRFFFKSTRKPVIKTGLTLEQAEEHCRDPETSSTTATSPQAIERTLKEGPWFDGYTKE